VSANLIILYKPQKNINASHTGEWLMVTWWRTKILTFPTSTTVKDGDVLTYVDTTIDEIETTE
jgi:hypothetical protein